MSDIIARLVGARRKANEDKDMETQVMLRDAINEIFSLRQVIKDARVLIRSGLELMKEPNNNPAPVRVIKNPETGFEEPF